MQPKVAIITGITGQDGSWLADLLLSKNYIVVGLARRISDREGPPWRIAHLVDNPSFILRKGDIVDSGCIRELIDTYQPDEFYNLAAMSFVTQSWTEPQTTYLSNIMGPLNCLEQIRRSGHKIKFYCASSSEQFGKVRETPQKETTPFHPRSPYGVSKCAAYYTTLNYRESYGIFACNGILFNHEGSRRGLEFVTRKITNAAARIYLGLEKELRLGNLEARRDWGDARDYMRAAWLMLQQDTPDDYVISTGQLHSIRQLLDTAFGYLKMDWGKYVIQDQQFMRPAEVDLLLGDSSKAHRVLNWWPEISFENMIHQMVEADLERNRNGLKGL